MRTCEESGSRVRRGLLVVFFTLVSQAAEGAISLDPRVHVITDDPPQRIETPEIAPVTVTVTGAAWASPERPFGSIFFESRRFEGGLRIGTSTDFGPWLGIFNFFFVDDECSDNFGFVDVVVQQGTESWSTRVSAITNCASWHAAALIEAPPALCSIVASGQIRDGLPFHTVVAAYDDVSGARQVIGVPLHGKPIPIANVAAVPVRLFIWDVSPYDNDGSAEIELRDCSEPVSVRGLPWGRVKAAYR